MALNDFFYRLGSFISGGKDSYTQTNFGSYVQWGLQKGETTVDTTWDNLYELARTTPQVAAVIDRKASMYSNGRWKHYKLVNGKKQLVENSEAVNILENPNPIQNGSELDKSMIWSDGCYGNSMVNLVRRTLPIPTAIYNLPMQYAVIGRSGKLFNQVERNKIIDRIYIEYNGTKEDFDIKNVIHFKDPNPNDPLMGISPLDKYKLAIANIRASMGFRNRIITNDAALGFMSSAIGESGMGLGLTPEDIKRMNEARSGMFGMQEGKSNIQYVEGNAKWNPMSYPTKDLMLFEEVDQDFKLIIDGFGLNENIFSFSKASTFSNYEQGLKAAYQDCIIPLAEDRALGFTKFFGMDGTNEWLEKDYSHLEVLKADKSKEAAADKTRAQTIQILQTNGRTDLADIIASEFKK
jgi:phage portal protein BeeE